jgi:hypothetical protein
MEKFVKLESINCWAGPLGIMPCDDNGLPIMEESRAWSNLGDEWYLHLSTEDKELVNTIINNKNNKS